MKWLGKMWCVVKSVLPRHPKLTQTPGHNKFFLVCSLLHAALFMDGSGIWPWLNLVLVALGMRWVLRKGYLIPLWQVLPTLPVWIKGLAGFSALTLVLSMMANRDYGWLGSWLSTELTGFSLPLWIVLGTGSGYVLYHYLLGFYGLFFVPLLIDVFQALQLQRHQVKRSGWLLGLLFVTILVLNQQSPVFFDPSLSERAMATGYDGFFVDVIFQTDTDPLFAHYHVFLRDVPALRQPLFSLLSFPLVAPLYGMSQLLFFIPQVYPSFVMTLQFVLLVAAAMMLKLLASHEGLSTPWLMGLYLSSYSLLIFGLILERFVITLFYMMLFLTAYTLQHPRRHLALLGAGGCNLLVFVLGGGLFDWRNLQAWRTQLWLGCQQVVALLGLMLLFGRLFLLAPDTLHDTTQWLHASTGLTQQLQQFSHLLVGSLVFPETVVNVWYYPRYEQALVTQFHGVGLVLLILCVYSGYRHRQEQLVRICTLWLGVAFGLFGLVGWATDQHNLLLFSVLFSFSWFYLLYRLLQQWLPAKLRLAVCGCLWLVLVSYNLLGMVDLIRFALYYYPR